MALSLPLYRLTLYLPRVEDATEATVLTPAAGAPHSDQFIVTTASGVAGAQPYLELPTGRVGSFDPVSRKLSVGNLSISLLDPRTTAGGANASRWATAFVGDAKGRLRLKGCKFLLERALDGNSASLAPYFAGRVRDVTLDGVQRLKLDLKDTADSLQRNCFTGVPDATITNAAMAALMPIGVPITFGNITATPRLTGTLSGAFTVANPAVRTAKLTLDATQSGWWAAMITKALSDFAQGGAPRLVVATVPGVGNVTLEWHARFVISTRLITGGSAIKHFALDSIFVTTRVGDPVGNIPTLTTTGVTFYIAPPADQPPSKSVPLLINDVHPVQLAADIIDGKYSVTSSGATVSLGTRDTSGGGPWATLLADPSFGTCRFIIEKPWKASDFLEQQLCLGFGFGLAIDASGRVNPFDLRKGAFTSGGSIDDTDLVTDDPVEWMDSRDGAITAVEHHSYADAPRNADDLANLQDQYPDLSPTMLVTTDNVILVANDLSTLADVGEKVVKIDALGLRLGVPTDTVAGEIDANTGEAKSNAFSNNIIAAVNDFLVPFQSGTLKFSAGYRLGGAGGAVRVGQFRSVNHTKLPNPATNQRGGARLALCIGRTESGPKARLEWLDFGPQTATSAPSLGGLAADVGDPLSISVAVTASVSTDVVEIWAAVTETSVGSAPATTADAWTRVGECTGSATVRCGPFPGGKRVWFRGRAHADGAPAAVTAWAYPSPAYLDLGALGVASSLTSSNLFANRVDLAWALADATKDVELFKTPGAAPGAWTEAMKIFNLSAGTTRKRVGDLTASTQYTFGVRVRDSIGGWSTMATLTLTTSSTLGTAPRPAAIDIASRPSG